MLRFPSVARFCNHANGPPEFGHVFGGRARPGRLAEDYLLGPVTWQIRFRCAKLSKCRSLSSTHLSRGYGMGTTSGSYRDQRRPLLRPRDFVSGLQCITFKLVLLPMRKFRGSIDQCWPRFGIPCSVPSFGKLDSDAQNFRNDALSAEIIRLSTRKRNIQTSSPSKIPITHLTERGSSLGSETLHRSRSRVSTRALGR